MPLLPSGPDPVGRIAVGLSGGVDSSVTAHLLHEAGHDVIGVYMRNWSEADPLCPSAVDAADAAAVAAQIGIPFYTFDLSHAYHDEVFRYFLAQNRRGRTPNPDTLCNKHIKFGHLLEVIDQLGCTHIATGHYARVRYASDSGHYQLCIPTDTAKDQTYFLHQLQPHQLQRALFPLADLPKSAIRQIATQQGFVTATKRDSTGICFIGERNYRQFLQQHLPTTPGQIITADSGQVVGEHQGLAYYTLGQRRDLHVGGVRGYPESPWFVIAKREPTNQLVVSQDSTLLDATRLQAIALHFTTGVTPTQPFQCTAKVRYRSDATPCTVTPLGTDRLQVDFTAPVRAITPGQSVVFYLADQCLGGGEIDTVG